MKRNLILLILVLCITLFNACAKKTVDYSYIVLDLEAQIEVVCNSQHKVVALNGINDEGKLLLINENLINNDVEIVIDKLIILFTKLGYINASNSEKVKSAINVSIFSTSNDIKNVVTMRILNRIDNLIKNYNLNLEIVQMDSKTISYFKKMVIDCDIIYTNDIEDLTDCEILSKVKDIVLEKSSLLKVSYEDYYFMIKNYYFKLDYQKKLFALLNDSNTDEILNFEKKIEELSDFEKGNFLTVNYQNLFNYYFTLKQDYLVINAKLANAFITGSATVNLEKDLNDKVIEINESEIALNNYLANIEVEYDTLISEIESLLVDCEALTDSLSNKEEVFGQVKEEFGSNEIFELFSKIYTEDIQNKYLDKLEKIKKDLISEISKISE